MQVVRLEHFVRAAEDIGSHGDNDMLPFDIDNRFISDKSEQLAKVAYQFFSGLERGGKSNASDKINSINVFTERLLSPAGASGFRISTKIHPFWNIYLNGLAIAIAEENEGNRSRFAHSYRFVSVGDSLFDRDQSWRAYKEATINNPKIKDSNSYVVQTDISSFYEHIYHHRVENCIADLFEKDSTVATQVDRLLSKISSGRSFGLPVGGQCSRILAELLMTSIDQLLTQSGVVWHRYVDDYTLIASSQAEAYKFLSILSNALADYGLSLNRTKTTILKSQHYENFVHAQLFSEDGSASKLKEIDLHFDPYSDNPDEDYEELVDTVQKLDVQHLLGLEIHKSQPDAFLIAQISRTLKLHDTSVALNLCRVLLSPSNLHSFRGSWSTIIRGVGSLRSDDEYKGIFHEIDELIDNVILTSKHLLLPEANCLHFLRILRHQKTDIRSRYVYQEVFDNTNSSTIKRACIDCFRCWRDRPSFIQVRNSWHTLNPEVQRMLWLASYQFDDEGRHFRNQVKKTISNLWSLGFEKKGSQTFENLYIDWVEKNAIS
ncbi:RNA-directed DNA polymerase [Vreelandella gomseomensis]|uniref:RNA-directed DNA polymerase n=1 Tax=Vreelandella gomseomensis TaxID=370766 RepID=A0ABU1GEH9_9GAMM|nr:RNA-directed DNA polymerase [Halomonas gomseomensis]MDR5875889.1 RNA-directed DNA polymerase [Halomonas gomseomensis]